MRFYFDVGNGERTIQDHEGVEAEDLEQALADARSVLDELAGDLDANDIDDPWTLIIRDQTGMPVAHIPVGLFSSPQRLERKG